MRPSFFNRAIVGLVFIYTSGTRASTGDINTEIRQTAHFMQGARVVGLSAAATKHELMMIEFEVERNNEKSQYYEKLKLSVDTPHLLANNVEYDWQDVWCKAEVSARNCQRLSECDMVYKPPSESKPVGIYAGCQEFSHFGALYEREVSQ